MDELVDVFDQLMDRLTKHCSETEKKKRKNFLQSTIHERHFFNMAYINEKWEYGEITMNKPKIALTIAGTDPTGGAGVMADLRVWRLWYGHYNKYRCSKYPRSSTYP